MPILTYFTISVTYLGLALGYIPGLRMNRPTIALVGASGLILLDVLSLESAWQSIDSTTIIFLLSMMVINAHLSFAGFFNLALAQLLNLTRSPLGLLAVLTFGSGILSAFFLNDTLALVVTPLAVRLTQTLKLNPIPYLLAIASATNIGSVATLSGNPQNILIGSFSQISYLTFLETMTPIAIIGLILQVAWLYWLYPEVRSTQPCPYTLSSNFPIYKPLFYKTLIITTGLLIAFVIGLPLAKSALAAACLLLITRRLKPQRILKEIDWNLLVLFSGLFILTQATALLNLLDPFEPLTRTPLGLLSVTAVLSNIISNVPTVLLLQSLIPPEATQSWLRLSVGSTLAGNLTLFGAIANLITVEAAAKLGYKLSFWEHLRFGVPLTLGLLGFAFYWI